MFLHLSSIMDQLECDVFQHLHVAELPRVRTTSKFMKNTVDTIPGIWLNGLQKSLPGIQFNLDLCGQPEEMAIVAELYPLLAHVT